MTASPTDQDFAGHTAIITGAGKGLGRAYALHLAARGCAIVASNRRGADGQSSAQRLVDEIRAQGGRAVAHDGAVEDADAAQAMVAMADEAFGGADIFISNAGIQHWRDFATVTLDEMRELLAVNLWGVILGLKVVWPGMVGRGYGRIVLTGSSAGLWGQMQSADYGASKGAMVGLARSLALDVPEGADIGVNIICPAAYTPLSAGSFDPKWADYAAPDHVAPVAAWLSSPACRTTGGIWHTGAGQVRRVQILESAVHHLSEGLADSVLPAIATAPEWTSSFASGAEILPEIAKEAQK